MTRDERNAEALTRIAEFLRDGGTFHGLRQEGGAMIGGQRSTELRQVALLFWVPREPSK